MVIPSSHALNQVWENGSYLMQIRVFRYDESVRNSLRIKEETALI